ncbi:uncharacterized protein AB675_9556 [Cyphellophora attinorum]|uniref:Calcineurin-like phosphoesterase domain-containing protein n=1 Tax=Cyphellophora attinorum TaxID=1664694 RepID=A0A0N1P1R1_9EURO|nr:uncharacterized protein AB675_9556 [Phialophora attinorum]KPI42254.1 hypothetical protein AB675_9556 [Phialophora attinorum]
MAANIKTRILFLPDTHETIPAPQDPRKERPDVIIHCGNLTDGSKLEDYQNIMATMEVLNAPLKLVMPRSNDSFMVDLKAWEHIGVSLLGKGSHTFNLANGAQFKIYADPHTPAIPDGHNPKRQGIFEIDSDTDIVITQVAPRGMMDSPSYGIHTGNQSLFTAVAKARPKIHCFAHGHEGRAAKLVRWSDSSEQLYPTLLSAIDKHKSVWIDTPSGVGLDHADSQEGRHKRDSKVVGFAHDQYTCTSNCCRNKHRFQSGKHTRFLNTSAEAKETHPRWFGMTPAEPQKPLPQRRWLVAIGLSAAPIPPSPALSASSYEMVAALDECSWPAIDGTSGSQGPLDTLSWGLQVGPSQTRSEKE